MTLRVAFNARLSLRVEKKKNNNNWISTVCLQILASLRSEAPHVYPRFHNPDQFTQMHGKKISKMVNILERGPVLRLFWPIREFKIQE